MRFYSSLLVFVMGLQLFSFAQSQVPAVYAPNVQYDSQGRLYYNKNGQRIYEANASSRLVLENLMGHPEGTSIGIAFDFKNKHMSGRVYYGLVHPDDSKHPQPVFFKLYAPIKKGKALVRITNFKGIYDMSGWQGSGRGTIGYRVVNGDGDMMYDGVVNFIGKGPFQVDYTIVDGPFVNQLTDTGVVISFTTNMEVEAEVKLGDKSFKSDGAKTAHEIVISGLDAATSYDYVVEYGGRSDKGSFRTAPPKGSRRPFSFAYASDSRAGLGGGERNLFGTNAYVMKKIMALCYYKDAVFFQFTGDMINGYQSIPGIMDLQYANWKRAIAPWARHMPVYVGMGNHEVCDYVFVDKARNRNYVIDRFPFESESAEAIFNKHFCNFTNGPESEDGTALDPSDSTIDFPSYKENVYYYTYDNVAVIVLNSDYLYAPTLSMEKETGGNLHGYIMDRQLEWLRQTVQVLEADAGIDHIFVTQHTPVFPNGGHVGDDMWYRGDNRYRPYIAGKDAEKGIIERRDQLLDLLINNSTKFLAFMTGDEHNFNYVEISPETKIYEDSYKESRIELARTVYQINNGSAGAPYYAQDESTPWTGDVHAFTTQMAVAFLHVDGKKVVMEVINPDTLEEIITVTLREGGN